jgi:hypothetical protein
MMTTAVLFHHYPCRYSSVSGIATASVGLLPHVGTLLSNGDNSGASVRWVGEVEERPFVAARGAVFVFGATVRQLSIAIFMAGVLVETAALYQPCPQHTAAATILVVIIIIVSATFVAVAVAVAVAVGLAVVVGVGGGDQAGWIIRLRRRIFVNKVVVVVIEVGDVGGAGDLGDLHSCIAG